MRGLYPRRHAPHQSSLRQSRCKASAFVPGAAAEGRLRTFSHKGRREGQNMLDLAPPTLTQSALRGLACRCPRCGKGKLYAGFLTLRPSCEACGLDYAFIDTGDGPAIFIIMLAGAIVVGSAMIVEIKYQPPYLLQPVPWR